MDALAAEALRRNDRYIREFVEALHICPYAKTCREAGKLLRRVLLSQADAPAAMAEVEAMPDDAVEVALLIFPSLRADGIESAREFESFCASLRPGLSKFYCVAF